MPPIIPKKRPKRKTEPKADVETTRVLDGSIVARTLAGVYESFAPDAPAVERAIVVRIGGLLEAAIMLYASPALLRAAELRADDAQRTAAELLEEVEQLESANEAVPVQRRAAARKLGAAAREAAEQNQQIARALRASVDDHRVRAEASRKTLAAVDKRLRGDTKDARSGNAVEVVAWALEAGAWPWPLPPDDRFEAIIATWEPGYVETKTAKRRRRAIIRQGADSEQSLNLRIAVIQRVRQRLTACDPRFAVLADEEINAEFERASKSPERDAKAHGGPGRGHIGALSIVHALAQKCGANLGSLASIKAAAGRHRGRAKK